MHFIFIYRVAKNLESWKNLEFEDLDKKKRNLKRFEKKNWNFEQKSLKNLEFKTIFTFKVTEFKIIILLYLLSPFVTIIFFIYSILINSKFVSNLDLDTFLIVKIY